MTPELTVRFSSRGDAFMADVLRLSSEITSVKKDSNFYVLTLEPAKISENISQLEQLWRIIRDWKGSSCTFGEVCLNINLNFRERVLKISECCTKAKISPESHCFHASDDPGWGCRLFCGISHRIPETEFEIEKERFWYQYGFFDESKNWVIDTPALEKALYHQCCEQLLFCCSCFDFSRFIEKIRHFPCRIDPAAGKFEIIRKKNSTPDETFTGIKPVLTQKIMLSGDNPGSVSAVRNIPVVRFEDIGGVDEIIDTVREVIELPIIRPEIFEKLGIRPHRGILLYGPPGCGKTMIAKAIAHETSSHFIAVQGPEIMHWNYGKSEENLRSIFNEALVNRPSVIYFDEFDSIAQSRSSQENLRVESRIVNQLLSVMDGIRDQRGVCVIASTNRPELLDRALLRPGRFDYSLEVKKPDENGCFRIFSILTSKMPLEKFDGREFSRRLTGLSGAEISFIVREAAYNCMRRNISVTELISKKKEMSTDELIISRDDFEKALENIKNRCDQSVEK